MPQFRAECANAYFFGEVWVFFGEGIIPLFHSPGIPTVLHTQAHTQGLIVCDMIRCPTALLPPGISHGHSIRIWLRYCYSSMKTWVSSPKSHKKKKHIYPCRFWSYLHISKFFQRYSSTLWEILLFAQSSMRRSIPLMSVR